MLNTSISGADALAKKLSKLPQDIRSEVKASMTRLCLKLVAKVKSDKLSGQVLKVRTGTLRRSVSYRVVDTPTELAGYVGTNVKYAAAHEYGFAGTVTIREHLRTVKQAFGKSLKEPTVATVRSHSRKVNLPERSFIRSAIRDMEPEIQSEIIAAIGRGIRK